METKLCSKCEQHKPATTEFFGNHKKTLDRLDCWCKQCRKEYMAAYFQVNPQKRAGGYYEDNKEVLLEKQKKYYQDNREKRIEYGKGHYEANKEKYQHQSLKWYYSNKDMARANWQRRRARLKKAEGNHTSADTTKQYEAQKGKCYYCSTKVKDSYHVDHVVPLSRGGSNGPENIVIACPTCNMKKHDKMPHEWPEGGRLL